MLLIWTFGKQFLFSKLQENITAGYKRKIVDFAVHKNANEADLLCLSYNWDRVKRNFLLVFQMLVKKCTNIFYFSYQQNQLQMKIKDGKKVFPLHLNFGSNL